MVSRDAVVPRDAVVTKGCRGFWDQLNAGPRRRKRRRGISGAASGAAVETLGDELCIKPGGWGSTFYCHSSPLETLLLNENPPRDLTVRELVCNLCVKRIP